MAVLNASIIKEASIGFKALFNKALNDQIRLYEMIATIVESNNISENYSWLGDVPSMREWVGDRVLKDIQAFKYNIEKKDWESTIEIDRDTFMFDKIGIVKPRIQDLAMAVIRHYNEQVFELLEKNEICYDGENFFSANHIFGKETDGVTDKVYSNKGIKKLTQDNLISTRNQMQSIKSDTGRKLYIQPNLLVVPPELEMKAREILVATQLNGSSNLTQDLMKYAVAPHLTNPNGWYLLDTTRAVKPIILQITKKAEFVGMDKPTDENVFMKKQFRYGVDTMDNVGYGLWQLAHYNDGSEVV